MARRTDKVSTLKARYATAKAAKVGTEVICPSCCTHFIKTNYQQAFCKTHGGTVCKDFYWNNVTLSKRNNTTRISPASAAYMAREDRITGYTTEGYKIIGGVAYDEFDEPVYMVDPDDDNHPFDMEA